MDTKSLEHFATHARRELLTAVDAQATAVLAPGSVARSERVAAVKKLEAEIAEHGRTHVIDKAAYTWFNRIIALRFMDANGYTDAGIVSPAQGQTHGQPEILADAKRDNLDTAVVLNRSTAAAITGLLDGTRRSTDAEGEAYALLLTEYCRYWHKSMPFMFEGEGDYTELLVPTGLLADGAILSRVRAVLTEEACADVEVIGWLYQFYISERKKEVFAGFKKNKKAGANEIPAATQLFTPHWIVRYLVENSLGRLWMLNRPASRLIEQMDYYVPPVDDNPDFLKISGPEELTLIDPACGSGHMLTYAFDLLYAIYEEEGYPPSEIPNLILTHNLYGTEIDARAGALAAFALTMKARAKLRTLFNKEVLPKICVIESISFGPDELDYLANKNGDYQDEEMFWNQFRDADNLGSLIQSSANETLRAAATLDGLEGRAEFLSTHMIDRARRVVLQAQYLGQKYSVVVANPPYMQSDNMSNALRELAQCLYQDEKADLFAMFIARNRIFADERGFIGMITMNSWMYLRSFEAVRQSVISNSQILTLMEVGTGAFPTVPGQVVAAAAFILQNVHFSRCEAVFFDLTAPRTSVLKERTFLDALNDSTADARIVLDQRIFKAIPGTQMLISVDEKMLRHFSGWGKVGDAFEPRAGISTGMNGTFIRYWFEVDRSSISTSPGDSGKWKLHNKGGGGERRWYGNLDYVLKYDAESIRQMEALPGFRHDGKDRYLQPHIGWSKISTKSPAFRFYPMGMTFDSGGLGLFARDEDDLFRVLLYLNSRLARTLIEATSPTLNLSPGQLAVLPLAPLDHVHVSAVQKVVRDVRLLWESNEESWGFQMPWVLEGQGRLETRLQTTEESQHQLGLMVAARIKELESAAGWGTAGDEGTPESLAPERSKRSQAEDVISYAVGCIFGRYSLDEQGLILADQGTGLTDYLAKVPSPRFLPDADNVIPFVDDGWFEDDIVERFRQFLRAAFGEEHFEENLLFVEQSLGVKTLRDYFITKSGKSKFYEDHVQRYKKRPIYWMFSSPKGSFNALVYMHRYNPSTVSTVLNEYLREYRAKLEVALFNAEQAAAAGSTTSRKEADRLRKVLAELRDYEHDVLYPLATQQIEIDLDDGVKANYPKFYPALKKITGLEASA